MGAGKELSKINYTPEDIGCLIEISSWVRVPKTLLVASWSIQSTFLGIEYNKLPQALNEALKTYCRHIEGTLGANYGYIREFVFTVPFEDVPLSLSDNRLILFATWRLKIGK